MVPEMEAFGKAYGFSFLAMLPSTDACGNHESMSYSTCISGDISLFPRHCPR
jgi:hypothetical protein